MEFTKNLAGPVLRAAGAGAVAAAGAANALPVLGFGAAGVKAGSAAALIQSSCYGAAVPAGGWFATAMSWGATGAMTATLAGYAAPIGMSVAAAYYFVG